MSDGPQISHVPATVQVDAISVVSKTLTNSQVKNLRATPVEVVPAPGTGYVNVVVAAVAILNAGANVFTETNDNIDLVYAGTSEVAASFETTGWIDQAADTLLTAPMATQNIITAANCSNKAINAFNNGDGEIGGNAANDATVTIVVYFMNFATGL